MSSLIQNGSIVKLKAEEKGALWELHHNWGYNKSKHSLRIRNISKEGRPDSTVVYVDIIDAHTNELITSVTRGYFLKRFMLESDNETYYYTDVKTLALVNKINVLWERQEYFKIYLTSK